MSPPLSEDLRDRIVSAWLSGGYTSDELAERFEVGRATVTRLKRRYRETNSVKPKPHAGGRRRQISPIQEAVLESLVQQHPDWTEDRYAEELAKAHGIVASPATVGRTIRRLGYSVKKKRSWRRNAIAQQSPSGDDVTSNKSEDSPLRIWYLWTKRARTSR